VTGGVTPLLVNHIRNAKDTLNSDFPLLVMRVHPATRQTFAGQKNDVGFAKSGGFRQFLAGMEPALEFDPERIKEGFDVHHFHYITARNMPEKHVTSFAWPIPRASRVFPAPGRGQTVFAPQAPGLIAHPVVGGGEAVEITFLPLDSPDQFDFLGRAGQQSLFTGNFANSLDFHDFASLRTRETSR